MYKKERIPFNLLISIATASRWEDLVLVCELRKADINAGICTINLLNRTYLYPCQLLGYSYVYFEVVLFPSTLFQMQFFLPLNLLFKCISQLSLYYVQVKNDPSQ